MKAAVRSVGNLPVPATTFVDRREDLAQLDRFLASARLVTLTGPAGVGKTRLALQSASRRRCGYPDGAWLVELADLRNPALVAHTVAYVLGIRESTMSLAEFLSGRQLLLVLDNCEHLVDACAVLVRQLLNAAARLRILVTSREPLRVPGEQVVPVAPLYVPATDGEESTGPAVDLFAQRAAVVAPSFAVTGRNRPHIVELCRRLDGLPLAIELAAARLNELSVEQLQGELSDRFRLLHTGLANGVRQRSLRTAVEWSYETCAPDERVLWARLSVFAGPVDLAGIEEVCTDARMDAAGLLDLLRGLVSKSIVSRRERAGEGTYQMLDTIREYGSRKLRESGAEDRLQRAQAARCLRLAEESERDWFGPRQAVCFAVARREHANLRSALDFYCAAGDQESALRLALALWFHWVFSGRVAEGRLWLERALAREGPATAARAGGLWACSLLASQQGDLDGATRLADAAYAVATRVDDPLTVARALARLAIVANYRREFDRTEAFLADAMARYEALGQSDNAYVVMALLTWANVRLSRGELDAAEQLCQRCAAICRSRGDRILLGNTLFFLAEREWLDDRTEQAARYLREAIGLEGADTPAHTLGQMIELAGWIAATAGQAHRAATLLGAAEQVWHRFGLQRMMQTPLFRDRRTACEAMARRNLSDDAYERAYRRGARLSLPKTVEYAAGNPRTKAQAVPSGTVPAITAREREVAELVADGLSNKEIAWRLGVAQRTAESHVERILTKLGLRTRAQIAAWVVDQRAGPPGGPVT